MRVDSLPERDQIVRRSVDAAWSYLEAVEMIDELRYERHKVAVVSALENISDAVPVHLRTTEPAGVR